MNYQDVLLIGVAMGAAVGLALLVSMMRQSSRVSRSYQAVADKWGGTYDRFSLASAGRLRISHARTTFVLRTIFQWKGGRITEFCVAWPDRKMILICRRRSTRDRVANLISRRVRTGNREFDARFSISGSPAERVESLLSGGVQAAMSRINQANLNRHLEFCIRGGKFTLILRGVVKEYHRVDALLRDFCELYDQLMFVETRDIEFLNNNLGAELFPAVCQICGEAIVKAAVACCRCDTLHHRECWRYFGACSVYACGERRSRRVKLAAR